MHGTVDTRFSSPDAPATSWAEVNERLRAAEIYWLTSVRTGGRPHTTPVIGLWRDEAMHFCTGPGEQKARNLAATPYCTLTTGANALRTGLDVVLEGEARPLTDAAELRALAAAYGGKYGPDWQFEVGDGMLLGDGGPALVFRVAPAKVFAFGRGAAYSQTVWRLPVGG